MDGGKEKPGNAWKEVLRSPSGPIEVGCIQYPVLNSEGGGQQGAGAKRTVVSMERDFFGGAWLQKRYPGTLDFQ